MNIDLTPLLRLKRIIRALRREPSRDRRVRLWGLYF